MLHSHKRINISQVGHSFIRKKTLKYMNSIGINYFWQFFPNLWIQKYLFGGFDPFLVTLIWPKLMSFKCYILA